MLSSKGDKFLNDVISYIKFPFDRDDIRLELKAHLLDKMDNYMEQGYDEETAENLTIESMGNVKEIGTELNKQHNPLIGWLCKINNIAVALSVIVSIYLVGFPLLSSLFNNDPVDYIDESNIIYNIPVDEEVQLDDTKIHFTNIILEKGGNMNIIYEYYDTKLWGMGWSLASVGGIYDNLGNKYVAGSESCSGGLVSKCKRILRDFSPEATSLIIHYDAYNREYRVEFPLQAGESND